MGDRVDINGHPTWVEERGDGGDTVLLLHGGLSNSDVLLESISPPIEQGYRVVAFDRRGHGYTADTEAPFHYDDMATETIGVLESVVGGKAHLVGWSDGGIISLFVALRRPDLVDRMVVIGANFHFDGIHPLEIDPESPVLGMMMEAYGERSPDGIEHFGDMLTRFMTMASTEPTLTTDDLAPIAAPTLVMAGDDDLVRLDHTCAMYEALPAGQLAIVPGTSHALPMERPDEVSRLILAFLAADASPQTLMPVLRAAHPA
jgi:pimeloyl-ACP methyl ester carboxylesterase